MNETFFEVNGACLFKMQNITYFKVFMYLSQYESKEYSYIVPITESMTERIMEKTQVSNAMFKKTLTWLCENGYIKRIKRSEYVINPNYIRRERNIGHLELWESNIPSSINYKTYIMYNNLTEKYKIGKSINPSVREKTLQSAEPDIDIHYIFDADIEKGLHTKYQDKRVRGEWFELDQSDIKEITTLHFDILTYSRLQCKVN